MVLKTYFMLVGGVLGLLLGWFGTFFGLDQLRVAMHASTQPQTIRLADLARHQPGDNNYVALTDFTPLWDGAVTLSDREEGTWSEVYVPLAPAGGRQQPRPQDARAIVMFNHVRGEAELDQALDGRPLIGLIKFRGTGLERYLAQRNPGLRFDQCWVVWEGHEPWSVRSAVGVVGAAIPLFALGLCLVVAGSQDTAPADQGAHHMMFTMSPLIVLIGGVVRWCRGRRWLSSPAAAAVLAGTGISVFALGGLFIWQAGFFSANEIMGQLIGGALLLDFGFGLLVCGCVCAIKAARRPAVPAEEAPAPVDVAVTAVQQNGARRQTAGYLLGGGAGAILAGFAWLNAAPAAGSTAAIVIGAGVSACIVGAFLRWGGHPVGLDDMPNSEQVRN